MFVIMRSTTSKQVQLLTQPWRVRELPPFVLKRGPWKIVGRCDEAHLKLNYRRALAREGYCVVDAKAALYRPDQLGQIFTNRQEVSMGLMEAWLNAAVREGFEHGRSLTEIAEETGLSESDVLHREVELKLIPQFAAVLSDTLASSSTPH